MRYRQTATNNTQKTNNALGAVRKLNAPRVKLLDLHKLRKEFLQGVFKSSSDLFKFGSQYALFCTALSTVNHRDMGQGMGQQNSLKFYPNYFARKAKEKFRNHSGFGTFLVAEAGLEPTTSGL